MSPPFPNPEGSWNKMPVIMITNAFPLKNRPYKFAIKPTANAPIAELTSLREGNFTAEKWLQVQPMQAIITVIS